MKKSTILLAIAGMSLYWPLLRKNIIFIFLSGYDSLPPQRVIPWYCIFLGCILVVTLFSIKYRQALQREFDKRNPALLLVFFLLGVTKLIQLGTDFEGPVQSLFIGLDAFLLAASFVLLTHMWAEQLSKFPYKTSSLVIVASFLMSFILQQVLSLSETAYTLLFVVSPLISALCWYASPTLKSRSYQNDFSSLKQLPLGLIAIFIVFLVAGAIIRGVFSGPLGRPTFDATNFQDFFSILFSALLLIVFALLSSRQKLLRVTWVIITTMLFAGLFLMALVGEDRYEIGQQFVVIGRTCMGFFFWLTLVDLVREKNVAPLLVFGTLFISTDVLSSFLGYVAVPFLVRIGSLTLASWAFYLSLGIAFLLVVASMVCLGSNVFTLETKKPAGEGHLFDAEIERDKRCELISQQFELTNKETEVAKLLSRGYSQKKISELLFVSAGTIQSHVKHIYRKMDIHSKQELIDLVDSEFEKK